MIGCAFDEFCDCCELLFEVVELSTALLNCSTCFGEAAPAFLGGGVAFLTVSVEPMLIHSAFQCAIVPLLRSSSIAGQKDVTEITQWAGAGRGNDRRPQQNAAVRAFIPQYQIFICPLRADAVKKSDLI